MKQIWRALLLPLMWFTLNAQADECQWQLEVVLAVPEVAYAVKQKVYSAWLAAKVLKGVTQKQIAAELKKNQSIVSKMLNEKQKYLCTKEELEILALLFDVPISSFLPEITAQQYAKLGESDPEEELKHLCLTSVTQIYTSFGLLVTPQQIQPIVDRVYEHLKNFPRPITTRQMDEAIDKSVFTQALVHLQ